MLRYWIHLLQEKRLYCSTCNAITSHRILAREPFSIHAEIPPEIPLVCQCKICESFVIAFSHEIFFGTKNAKAEYAKPQATTKKKQQRRHLVFNSAAS